MKRIAIVVGHSEKAQGAVNFHGVSEFDFNSAIAAKVALELQHNYDCDAKVFFRKSNIVEVGTRVKQFDPHFSLELHFNAAGYPVPGAQTEILCLNYKTGIELAQRMAAAFEAEYRYKLRRDKGAKVLGPESRGFMNLHSTGKMEALLIEPVFGDFETAAAKDFFSKPERYVSFLSSYIAKELGLRVRTSDKSAPQEDFGKFKEELLAALDRLTAALDQFRI